MAKTNDAGAQGPIDSHIQMPKCALKQFEDKHHKYFYYDVEKKFIGNNGHARSTNTSLNYYSWEIEQFFNSNFEKPYSKLFQQVNEITCDPPRGHIDSAFDYAAKRFVYNLNARNPQTIETRYGNPILKEYAGERELHDLGAMVSLAAEVDRDFLEDYGTTVVVNTTGTPFVLPTCGVYYLNIRDYFHAILPVSPEKAIAFIEEQGKDSIISNGIVHVYSIEQEKDITFFNNVAFTTQIKYGVGFIVCPERKPLEIARKDFLESNSR